MLRTCAALSVLALLVLVFVVALNSGGPVSSLQPGSTAFQAMTNAQTGRTLTLESVQKDVVWHRETALKLRELD